LSAILPVRVTPRSAKPGIGGWRAGADGREELEVRVSAAPTDGAANEAVLKLLAQSLGVSRSELAIIAGETSRHKRITVPFEPEEVRRRLGG
jgi:uncharacterized protein (TIGR00251 family)